MSQHNRSCIPLRLNAINNKKSLLLIFLVFLVFFLPVFISGKSLYPVAPGRSILSFNEQIGLRNGIMNPRYLDNGATDWIEAPFNAAAHQAIKDGELPLWNPYSSLGMPILANTNGATVAPLGFLLNIDNSEASWNAMYIGRLLFAVLFTFYFLRRLSLGQIESVSAALLFGFSGYAQLHLNMFHFHVDAMIPFLLWSSLRFAQEPSRLVWLLLVFAVIGMILGGNPQNMVLGCAVAAAFFVYTTWDHRVGRYRMWSLYCAAFAFGIGCCFFYGASFLETFQRALKYHNGMGLSSFPWTTILGLLFPVFLSAPSAGVNYMPYLGFLTIPVIAAGLRLCGQDVRPVRFFLIVAIFFVLKIVGFPGVNWVGGLPVLDNILFIKYISVFYFSVAILFAYAIRELLTKPIWNRRFFALLLLAIVGIALLRPLMEVRAYKPEVMINWLILLFFVGALATWGALRYAQSRTAPVYAVLAVILCELLFARLYAIDKIIDAGDAFVVPKFVQFIKRDRQHEFDRVFATGELLMGNQASLYGVQDIRGLSATTDERYYQFMRDLVLGGKVDLHPYTTTSKEYAPAARPFLDLLGVKYLIFDDCKEHPAVAATVVYTQMCMQIHKNHTALDRAFVVHSYRTFENESHVLEAMRTQKIDYVSTALLTNASLAGIVAMQGEPGVAEGAAFERPQIVSYTSSEVTVMVDMQTGGILVLSDLAFPGWNVYVDGQKQELLVVDYILRGVALRPGKHHVSFQYEPGFARTGVYVSMAFLLLTFLFAYFFIGRRQAVPVFPQP